MSNTSSKNKQKKGLEDLVRSVVLYVSKRGPKPQVKQKPLTMVESSDPVALRHRLAVKAFANLGLTESEVNQLPAKIVFDNLIPLTEYEETMEIYHRKIKK